MLVDRAVRVHRRLVAALCWLWYRHAQLPHPGLAQNFEAVRAGRGRGMLVRAVPHARAIPSALAAAPPRLMFGLSELVTTHSAVSGLSFATGRSRVCTCRRHRTQVTSCTTRARSKLGKGRRGPVTGLRARRARRATATLRRTARDRRNATWHSDLHPGSSFPICRAVSVHGVYSFMRVALYHLVSRH